MPNNIDWGVTAQMLTAVAAVAALLIGPLFAGYLAQKSLVSQSRQNWLNQIRADIARILSLHSMNMVKKAAGQIDPTSPEFAEIALLLSKIRMMLNPFDDDHIRFLNALGQFMANYDMESEAKSIKRVTDAFEPIRKRVWSDIKAGKVR